MAEWEGSVYRKGRKWWLCHKELGSDEWTDSPTPFYQHDPEGETKARALLAEIREKWRAHSRAADGDGPLTVARYVDRWLERRRRQGIDSVREEEQRLRMHVLPLVGEKPLVEVRRADARAMLEAWKEKPRKTRKGGGPSERLAPRTILHIYRTARQVFRDAAREELIDGNPIDLDVSELPRKRDKDPTWRADARLSLEEVELLISDPAVPEDRRVLYAIEFLTGSRSGEAAALRWHRWDRGLRPLGCLTIARAYNTRRKAEKEPKTGRARRVPVHPTLAKILAGWKLSGFQRYTGRKPQDEDLVVPSATDRHRNVGYSLTRFHRDLDELGLRKRRHYDSRRTFRSLAGDHGAAKDRVRWLTHAPRDVLDDYDSPSWEALCEAVLSIPVKIRARGAVARLR